MTIDDCRRYFMSVKFRVPSFPVSEKRPEKMNRVN